MSQTWGDFQAVVQLSAGLNVAILSFVDISLPAIKERRRVFAKAQQELDMHRSAPGKVTSAAQLEHDCQIDEMNQKLYLLWKESSSFSSEEDSLIHSTGILGFIGAALSLFLLWYSAEYYDASISVTGKFVIGLSFCSLIGAFIINFMTASQASVFTKQCNQIREEMRQKL
ncbi:hypothetical protein LV564_11955 [Komagataeibacter nataicola]|uniref:DUF2721 domain-containing protein n=1 Tax=Komagataeibacter nataicola TaxID=265960 RepID=A0ABX5P6P5_9PROT|nr:hypothetical protein [Komagataeibacter nataicola]PYD64912.1 hypothetical protein CDI09_16600 [Komagataeibacter nataicola]WEQ54866.1 hypothetical protein LV564_11955 [Komagataeibacter nataicola]WNM09202.1 hypothetical protein RI056_04115 [Komagataeibacter nataicola]GBR23718.1 hypothetical protein AA0616_2583 [Komagataeibacter nataicola NRIC 0616]